MLIQRATVYRLEPTEEQAALFGEWAGACRLVYNLALEQRSTWGADHKLSYNQQQSELTQRRADYDWLMAVPVHALQMAVRSLDNACQRFFCGLGGYPTPRKTFINDSFSEPDPACLGFKRLNKKRGAVKFPKVGRVKFVGFRKLGGTMRSVPIRRQAGHWFASIAWRREVPDPEPGNLPSVGIDAGIKLFAALSDGASIRGAEPLRKSAGKLARRQRRLARKTKFGANWRRSKPGSAACTTGLPTNGKDFCTTRPPRSPRATASSRWKSGKCRPCRRAQKALSKRLEAMCGRRAVSTARYETKAGLCSAPFSATSWRNGAGRWSKSILPTPLKRARNVALWIGRLAAIKLALSAWRAGIPPMQTPTPPSMSIRRVRSPSSLPSEPFGGAARGSSWWE